MLKKFGFMIALSLLITACSDSDDNSAKTDDNDNTAASCGNGKTEDGEQCDDANTEDGDGCSKDCKIEQNTDVSPVCGNGKTEDGEQCDDANTEDGDGCSKDCKIEQKNGEDPVAYVANVTPNPGPETRCDDGKHEAGEICDPVYNGQYIIDNISRNCYKDETTGKCVLEPVEGKNNCGNGLIDDGEECDDGNTGDGDGCSRYCKNEDSSICQMKNGVVAKVLLVVDGDTLKIEVTDDGSGCTSSKYLTVRMHGIDAPECGKDTVTSPILSSYSAYACTAEKETVDGVKSQKGGLQAGEFVKSLVYSEENNGTVFIECETRGADDPLCLMDSTNYRYLAYIRLKKDGKDADLAQETLKAGYAMAYTDFTAQRTDAYCAAEAEAVKNKAGVWSYAATASDVVTTYMNDKSAWFNADSHCR